MKVKYIGKEKADFLTKDNDIDLLKEKVYNVVSVEMKGQWYRVVDESGEDYLYPKSFFEIVEQ
jgi:hypothetical protein